MGVDYSGGLDLRQARHTIRRGATVDSPFTPAAPWLALTLCRLPTSPNGFSHGASSVPGWPPPQDEQHYAFAPAPLQLPRWYYRLFCHRPAHRYSYPRRATSEGLPSYRNDDSHLPGRAWLKVTPPSCLMPSGSNQAIPRLTLGDACVQPQDRPPTLPRPPQTLRTAARHKIRYIQPTQCVQYDSGLGARPPTRASSKH